MKQHNNYAKMRRTNSKIKEYLIKNKYENIFFIPHMKFSKDYNLDNLSFDGFCSRDNKLMLFQCKSNFKPSKPLLAKYKEISNKYNIICAVISYFDRKGVFVFS